MTDESENTWFRRNLIGLLISALLVVGGFAAKQMYSDVCERIGSLSRSVTKVTDDHEARIRALEHK